MSASFLLAVLGGAVAASAHGYITDIIIAGKSHAGYNPTIAPWVPVQDSIGWQNWATDTGFVSTSQLQTPDIICHRNSTNAPISATVAAGTDVELRWSGWPDSHHGPVIDYIASCHGDCETVDKSALEFAKIAEKGQFELGDGAGETGYWAADTLLEMGLTWTVTIPASLRPGNYVLRHEIIALHEGFKGGAQFYPQCLNLVVTGSGTDDPPGIVATELYRSDDPGVFYNIYNDETDPTYVIPGPPLWKP
jgi:cellulase